MRKYGPIIKKASALFKKISKKDLRAMYKGSKTSRLAAMQRVVKKTGLLSLTRSLRNSKNTGKSSIGDTCKHDDWCASGACKGGKCVENGLISTITLGVTVDVSFVLGGATYSPIMGAFDVSNNRGSSKPLAYAGVAWSVGFTVGVDIAPEIGFWNDVNTALSGDSHGFVIAGAYGYGLGLSFWWDYSGRFLGFTIVPQVGVGGELEYSRAHTGRY